MRPYNELFSAKPEGLTADDRSLEDQQKLDEIYTDSTYSNPGNYEVSPVSVNDTTNVDLSFLSDDSFNDENSYPTDIRSAMNAEIDFNKNVSNAIDDELARYKLEHNYNPATQEFEDQRGIAEDVVAFDREAYENSSYYKKYHRTDKINLTPSEKALLYKRFQLEAAIHGEEAAAHSLNRSMKEEVANNQSWLEQSWDGFKGIGASAASAAVVTAGILWGLGKSAVGDLNEVPGAGFWKRFLDTVIDNEVTNYGADIMQYGAILPDNIAKAKSYATKWDQTGLSEIEIVKTQAQENSLFNATTIPEAAQSAGFSLLSMGTGFGLSKGATFLSKQVASRTANIMAAKGASKEAIDKILTSITRFETGVQRTLVPGLVGTVEGVQNGLDTMREVRLNHSAAEQEYREAVEKETEKRFNSQVFINNDGTYAPPKSYAEIQAEVEQELYPKFQEIQQQIEYAAVTAGINDFYINSVINGFVNATFQAGLQHQRVQSALRDSRLTGWAFREPNITLDADGVAHVTTPLLTQIYQIGKEPVSEALEEYLQTLSSKVMVAGAEENIHRFTQNKYADNGEYMVGKDFASSWSASWKALGETAFSFEAAQAALLGGLSSIIGVPNLPGGRTYKNADTGKLERSSSLNIFSNLKRGVNAEGQKESWGQYAARITPWRSGLLSQYKQTMIFDKDEKEQEAKAITEWFKDKTHRDKFDGLVGTANWAIEMQKGATSNDEYSYRNSALGKTINDAFMLQKIAHTEQGKAILRQLEEISNLSIEDSAAQAYISAMRDNVNINTEGMSDEDILGTLRKNAMKMRTTLSTINEESEKIDRLLGNVDDDTKQSLIYGNMMLEDWKERRAQLEKEVSATLDKIENSRGASGEGFTEGQKELMARHGSMQAATSAMHRLSERLAKTQQEIETLEKLGKDRTPTDESQLRVLKAQEKVLSKQLKKFDALSEEAKNLVLNEKEIMSLDHETRGQMLRLGSQKLYTTLHMDRSRTDFLNSRIDELRAQRKALVKKAQKNRKNAPSINRKIKKIDGELNETHRQLKEITPETRQFYSNEQQAVIDNLVNQGMAIDENFLDKVVDLGRMESAINRFYDQRRAIMTDTKAFTNYIRGIKLASQLDRIKRRAQHIATISNYVDFAKELDRAYSDATPMERDLITKELRDSGSANWEKYMAKRKEMDKIIDQLSQEAAFDESFSPNDVSLLGYAFAYLQSQDIDLYDTDAVTQALGEYNEENKFKFIEYLDAMNSEHLTETKTVFTSLSQLISDYKTIISRLQSNNRTQENLNREVTPNDTPSPVTPTPPAPAASTGPNIFTDPNGAYNSPNEGQPDAIIDEDGTTATDAMAGTPTNTPTTAPSTAVDPEWSDFLRESVSKITDFINNSSYTDEVKEEVLKQIDALKVKQFTDTNQFIGELEKLAGIIERQGDEKSTSASKAIRAAINELTKTTAPENPATRASTSAAIIETENIEAIRAINPDSWKVKFYDQYHIEQYIRDHPFSIYGPDIFFMTDTALAEEEQKEKGNNYADTDEPVIALVKDDNGPIEINGVKYQPIGILPSTNARVSGSVRAGQIRELSSTQTGRNLILDRDGNPVSTRASSKGNGARKAHSADNNLGAQFSSVQEAILNDLTDEDRVRLLSLSKDEMLLDPVYKEARNRFIKKLLVKDNPTKDNPSNKNIFYEQDNLKGGSNKVAIKKNTIQEVTNSKGKHLNEVTSDEELVEFNAITKMLVEDIQHMEALNDKFPVITSESTDEEIKKAEETLRKAITNTINRHIYLSPKSGVALQVSFDTQAAIDSNGEKIQFQLSYVNSNDSNNIVNLGTVEKGSDLKSLATILLRETLFKGTELRPGVFWQDIYEDVSIANGKKPSTIAERRRAFTRLMALIDSGVYGFAGTTTQYQVESVRLNAPFAIDGSRVNFNTYTNPDNATPVGNLSTPPSASTTATTTTGTIVDASTGIPVAPNSRDNSEPENPALTRTKEIMRRLQEISARFKLSSDEKSYESVDASGNTNRTWGRVTSAIESDENGSIFSEWELDEDGNPRLDDKGNKIPNKWIIPSTRSGNVCDDIFRDFFDGLITKDASGKWMFGTTPLEEHYPNATAKELQDFVTQAKTVSDYLDSQGITVIAKGIKVSGYVTVTDKNGKHHQIPVAGTLDLIGYDQNGKIHIFDMKTIHRPSGRKSAAQIRSHLAQSIQKNTPKWSRQVSLYADLLKQMFPDINIDPANLHIIPIGVSYPDPVFKNTNGETQYSGSPKDSNEILIDSKRFGKETPKGIAPVLVGNGKMHATGQEAILDVGYTPLNLSWDKLQASEKGLANLIQDSGTTEPQRVSVNTNEPQRKKFEDPALTTIDTNQRTNPTTVTAPNPVTVSSKYDYDNLSTAQKKSLKLKGIKNKEAWNKLTTQEMDKYLGCC